MKSLTNKKTPLFILTVFVVAVLICFSSCSSSDAGQDIQPSGGDIPEVVIGGSGTEDDPWLIGADNAADVQAFTVDSSLIINGTGRMIDFENTASRPWDSVIADLEQIDIFDPLTHIGKNAFKNAGTNSSNFDVFLSDGIVSIGDSAFEGANFYEGCIVTVPETVTDIGSLAFADTKISRFDFDGTPSIADNAFSNVSADIYVRCDSDWNESNMLPYGGELTYKQLYAVSIVEDYGTEDISGEGVMYIPEDQLFEYNAEDYISDEGYHFVRYEIQSGDLSLVDPTDPEISVQLTGSVSIKIIYAADNK